MPFCWMRVTSCLVQFHPRLSGSSKCFRSYGHGAAPPGGVQAGEEDRLFPQTESLVLWPLGKQTHTEARATVCPESRLREPHRC